MLFLTPDEISILTGRKIKRLQIEQLRKMGIPFRLNAAGKPIVTRSAVEGGKESASTETPAWEPAVLQRAK